MSMSLITKLFGKWQVVQEAVGEAGYSSPIFGRQWREDVVVTVERNSKTQKERAFIARLTGEKQPISLAIAKSILPKVSP